MNNEAPAILGLDQDHCIAHWRTLFLHFWGTTTHTEAVDETMRHLERLDRREEPMLGLMIVTVDSRAPAPAARDRLDQLARRMLAQSSAFAYVYEGMDLRGAAIRSLLVKLQFELDRPARYKFCRSVNEALTWLSSTAPEELHGTALARARAVQTVRSRFEKIGLTNEDSPPIRQLTR